MAGLTQTEQACVEHASAEPMLAQVEAWAAVNSGTRNLAGLATIATMLADAFSALPGELALLDPAPVEGIAADGKPFAIEHGRNLHLVVRPEARLQILFTGHMDTVFGADHPFQALHWIEDGVLGGP